MLEDILKQIVIENKQKKVTNVVILNYLKEYVQCLVLNLLYNHRDFQKLVFKGGSCLRVCFNLPRLSEDLDFDYSQKQFNGKMLTALSGYLNKEIKNKHFSSVELKNQSNSRLYLKFPILRKLEIASRSESDKLYVKIETSEKIEPCANFTLTPVSKFGFNFIAYHYDLPSMMSGKINAILSRLWFKGKQQEIDIKGRDYYDLYWFFKNKVVPNWKMLKKLTKIKTEKALKAILKDKINKAITGQKLNYDLRNFIADQEFVDNFSRNYPEIMKKYL